jgi:hypothetical protein
MVCFVLFACFLNVSDSIYTQKMVTTLAPIQYAATPKLTMSDMSAQDRQSIVIVPFCMLDKL